MHITTENDLRNFFLRHKHLALYGTGGMGHNIYCYLRANHWEKQLDFYIVTLRTAKTFHGLPVHEVETLSDKERKYPVLIATRNNFHAEIKKSLQDAGVKDIYTLSEPLLNMTERIAQSLPSENAPQQEAIVPPSLHPQSLMYLLPHLRQSRPISPNSISCSNRWTSCSPPFSASSPSCRMRTVTTKRCC